MRLLAVSETLALAGKHGIEVARQYNYPQEMPPFPAVVAKPDSSGHKSDKGLVFLGIGSEGKLKEAIAAIRPEKAIVQEMVTGTELILGAKKDLVFGHVVMVGIGGTLAEAYADVAFGICPVSIGEAGKMVGSLKGKRILAGFRGRPAVGRLALAEAICALSELAVSENVSELDLNPVIATADGRIVAVDGRAVLD